MSDRISRWRDRPFPLQPAPIHVPDDVLADLQQRLALTRWPADAGNQDWYYGVDRGYLQELVEYWRTGYDWCQSPKSSARMSKVVCMVRTSTSTGSCRRRPIPWDARQVRNLSTGGHDEPSGDGQPGHGA
jgi:hypothetical protein